MTVFEKVIKTKNLENGTVFEVLIPIALYLAERKWIERIIH
jgi:hypothetical protein